MSDNNDFWSEFFKSENEDPDTSDATKIVPEITEDPLPQEFQTPQKESADNDDATKFFDNFGHDPEDTGPKAFKVNFDFDDAYKDVKTPKPLARRKERRSGCVGGILYGVFIICISLILGSFLWMAAVDVLALGKPDSEIILTIPEDAFVEGKVDVEDEDGNVIGEKDAMLADIDQISEIMYDNGLIRYKWLFKLFCKFSHASTKIGEGTYTLNTKFDYRALVYGTTPGSAKLVEVSVMIPEGYTMKQIFAKLEENEVCTQDELWEAAKTYSFENDYKFLSNLPPKGDQYRLEGYLFPDTYYFYMNDDPVRVIKKFLANFENKFGEMYIDRAAELGYSMHDIVIIASMIEREASSHEGERDMIASVIYNRINSSNFYCLQIDATILYGMDRNGDAGEKLSTEYDSPYNTYQNGGLPPGPIANPGEASIRGALYPESSSYYYYALHKDEGAGTWHEFFTNYDSFLNFVNSDSYGG